MGVPDKRGDKRRDNLDYVLRSGLAGGVAGCAVRVREFVLTAGQDGDCATRPCQDPIPNKQSRVQKVYWAMAWRG